MGLVENRNTSVSITDVFHLGKPEFSSHSYLSHTQLLEDHTPGEWDDARLCWCSSAWKGYPRWGSYVGKRKGTKTRLTQQGTDALDVFFSRSDRHRIDYVL